MTATSSRLADALRGALTGALLSLRVDCVPSPSHRPQVGKFGAYYAKSYNVCMAACLKQLAEQRPPAPLQGDLGAILEIVIAKPKTTKRERPVGDVDNYSKCVLDAATKVGVWEDDGLVMALVATKRWTAPGEEPGINLLIGSLA